MSSYRSLIASGAGRRASSTLHVLSSGALTEAYIEDLKLFRFSTHPKIAPKIEEMKTEITKYNSLVKSIKPLPQRLDPKGNDTFSRCSASGAPTRVRAGLFAYVATCSMLCSPTPPTRSRRSVSSPCSTTPSMMTWPARWQTTSSCPCSCNSILAPARTLRG